MTYAERLADDSDPLRVLLQAARSWRVPPTVFMRQRTVNCTEWTDADTELALALDQYEAGLCPGCHSPIAETTRAEHDPNAWDDPYTELAEPVQCHKCVARANAAKAHEENENASALLYTIGLKEKQPA